MFIKQIYILFLVSFLVGCSSSVINTKNGNNGGKGTDANGQVVGKETSEDDLWDLTRTHFQFEKEYSNPRVEKQITYYSSYKPHMPKVSAQATPFYHYVLNEIIKRDFPTEVALLPVIESLYDPTAYSSGKASGIWQFIPSTATYLGIEINDWYDGRRDVITSTQTALDYLESLNKRFDGDWMLTFAAYNGGGGTVSRAIRKNKEKGLKTDYWSLSLPKETTLYVPKILAIAAIIKEPAKYQVTLPSIPNTPYFEEVILDQPVNLNKLAVLSNTNVEDIKQLNAGFIKNVTLLSGTHKLLVPVDNSESIKHTIANLDDTSALQLAKHKVKRGDSLGKIAQQYDSSIQIIKDINDMKSSKIRIGKTLLIPVIGDNNPNNALAVSGNSKKHTVHRVSNGDTVWGLARKHKVSVKKILAFNGLTKQSTLHIGSSIKIPQS